MVSELQLSHIEYLIIIGSLNCTLKRSRAYGIDSKTLYIEVKWNYLQFLSQSELQKSYLLLNSGLLYMSLHVINLYSVF